MNEQVRHRIAIVGAGIIGSAVAFELARRGIADVHVFDPDLQGVLSSTERNAGGVRHLWLHPINAELSRVSIKFFESIHTEIGFKQSGYLWLYPPEKAIAGEAALKLSQSRGLDYVKLSPAEITVRYPFIDKTDGVAFAILGEKDGILNSNSLKTYLRSQAKTGGVTFHDRCWASNLRENTGSVELSIGRLASAELAAELLESPGAGTNCEPLNFDQVILCAGAWTSELLKHCDVKMITRPVRRQIATFKAEDLDLAPYGMIVDTTGVYFHAEGGNLLAGLVLKDEPDGFHFQYDDSFFESHIWPALFSRSSKMERLKPSGGWAGLYSYTPDITGILGRVPGFAQVFESHSYTGHGIMHSIGAAIAMIDLVVDGKFNSIDALGLSRDRFTSGKLLQETLHI